MNFIIVGLGNPGEEFVDTRHNAGRMVVELAAKQWHAADWRADKRLQAQLTKAKVGKKGAELVLPDTFMNNSGKAVKPLVKSIKAAANLVVVHDDMDLPLGVMKVSFNRGSGGHKGVESVVRAVKTNAFTRIRLGVSPHTPKGKVRKPQGDDKVLNFIIGKFKANELTDFKKIVKRAVGALETIVTEGVTKAMNSYN